MSLSPVIIQPGIYTINNIQYASQDADLLFPGGTTGTIGSYHRNNQTKRMQWQVASASSGVPGQYTFTNQEITTYASILQAGANLKLAGNPTNATAWVMLPNALNMSQYLITALNPPVMWGIANGNDGIPITLDPVSNIIANNYLWSFELVN